MGGQTAIVDTVNLMIRSEQQAPQRWVIDLGHHVIVEYCLPGAIEDCIRNPPPEQPANQRLGARVWELDLGGEAEPFDLVVGRGRVPDDALGLPALAEEPGRRLGGSK